MWGPTTTASFKQFESIPYAPFSKSDKIGRVADWYEQEEQQQQQSAQRLPGGAGRRLAEGSASYGAGVSTAFAYTHEQDDSSFAVVDRTGAAIIPTVPLTGTVGRTAGARRIPTGAGSAWSASRSASNSQQQASKQQTVAGSSTASGMKVLRSGNVSQRTPMQNAYQKNARRFGQWGDKPQRVRETSVAVGPQWQFIEEYQLSAFGKLMSADVPAARELVECGELKHYDRSYDRLTVKTQKSLRKSDRLFNSVTASEDPILRQLWQENQLAGGGSTKPVAPIEGDLVLATAQVLAALMTAGRSVNSWDIILRRQTDPKTKRRCLIFDKRQSSSIDYQTVSETAAEPPVDIGGDRSHPNSPFPLSVESTTVSRYFSQQVLQQREFISMELKNPFEQQQQQEQQQDELASIAYRYRKWDLTPAAAVGEEGQGEEQQRGGITLICRSEVESYLSPASEDSKPTLLSVNALNENYPFDPETGLLKPNYGDWRSRLDTQRGAVLTEEMRNNSWKLCRWAVESILAGADQMKIGFVSRAAPLNPQAGHVVLGVQTYQPAKFAEQLGLNLNNAFGILKSLVDVGLRQPEDGRYVLLKDPSDAKVRLYRVPDDIKIPGYGDDDAGEEEYGDESGESSMVNEDVNLGN